MLLVPRTWKSLEELFIGIMALSRTQREVEKSAAVRIVKTKGATK